MTIEQIVPDLSLCKQLKELGYPQHDSVFYWITSPVSGKNEIIYYEDRNILEADFVANRYGLIAAPTASELMEIIATCGYINVHNVITTSSKKWCADWQDVHGIKSKVTDADTISNALTETIIWLATQGYIEFGKKV